MSWNSKTSTLQSVYLRQVLVSNNAGQLYAQICNGSAKNKLASTQPRIKEHSTRFDENPVCLTK